MVTKENARHAEDLGNQRHDERSNGDSKATAVHDDTATGDEHALRLAREWREGKWDAWFWLVGRLARAQAEGRTYESFRRLTDELSQVHDFVDDGGRKVSVPHNRGLGRGIALLMVEEHPEFAKLFRMRGAR